MANTAAAAPGLLSRGWQRISRRNKRRATATTMTHAAAVEEPSIVDEQRFLATSRDDQTPITPPAASSLHDSTLFNRKSALNRGMDKLRRSLRKSFHRGRKNNRLTANQAGEGSSTNIEAAATSASIPPTSGTSSNGGKHSFQLDEAAVRAGTCSFQVKYLGSCEVFESRGMNVCEGALRHLRERKRSTKAVLYVSGDSLRVVDQEQSRGLILDQTVEKVSFCAPDRKHDRGFAYICRDGATRRWLCHGFNAVKESGERLSHAVGCSFAVCLEKKKKREAQLEVYQAAQNLADEIKADHNGSLARNNQAYSSFRRQLSLSERRADPQTAIVVEPAPLQRPAALLEPLIDMASPDTEPINGATSFENAATAISTSPTIAVNATETPVTFFERQSNSFHSLARAEPPLRRYHSLRSDQLAKSNGPPSRSTLYNSPIYEGDESWPGEATLASPQPPSAAGDVVASATTTSKRRTPPPLPAKPPQLFTSTPVAYTSAPVSHRSAGLDDEWLQQLLQSPTTAGQLPPRPPPPQTNGMTTSPATSRLNEDPGLTSIRLNETYEIVNGKRLSNWQDLSMTASFTRDASAPPVVIATAVSSSAPTAVSTAAPTVAASTATVTAASTTAVNESVKYEKLVEESDPPQSPTPVVAPPIAQFDLFGQPVFASPVRDLSTSSLAAASTSNNHNNETSAPLDPFDVRWSSAILHNAKNGGSTAPSRLSPHNPFITAESAPVNV